AANIDSDDGLLWVAAHLEKNDGLYRSSSRQAARFIGEPLRDLRCGSEPSALRLKIAQRALSPCSFDLLNGVRNHSNPLAALQQALGSKLHAILRDDAEDNEFGISGDAVSRQFRQQFLGMRIAKDVELVFLNDDLLILLQIAGQMKGGIIW